MKIAISIPDHVFTAGEKLAKKMKVCRSKLYALAVDRLLAEQSSAEIDAKLREVYGEVSTSLDEPMLRQQAAVITDKDEDWHAPRGNLVGLAGKSGRKRAREAAASARRTKR